MKNLKFAPLIAVLFFASSLLAQIPAKVNSIAALEAIVVTGVASNASVNVLGYYVPNDGGGGSFTLTTSSSATVDHGMVCSTPSGGTTRWLRNYSGPVSVKWLGAKGDFSNNDSTAINLGVAWLTSVGGGKLYFPTPATAYGLITAINVRSNIEYFGDGYPSLIKSLAASVDSVISTGAQNVTNYSNIIVRDLAFDGNRANCAFNTSGGGGNANDDVQIGVRFLNSSQIILRKCLVSNTVMDGVSLYGTTDVEIVDNELVNIGKTGALPPGAASFHGVIIEATNTRCRVRQNKITTCRNTGIFAEVAGTDVSTDLTIASNKIYNTQNQGLFCFILGGSSTAVFTRTTLLNNTVSNCSLGTNDYALQAASSTTGCKFNGLVISGNFVVANNYAGFIVGNGGGVACFPSPLITNNIISGNANQGYFIAGGCVTAYDLANYATGNGAGDFTDSGITTFSVGPAALLKVVGGANAALTSTTAWTSGAGGSVGTLTNAPSAGNPTSWIKFNDNGTLRYVPAW